MLREQLRVPCSDDAHVFLGDEEVIVGAPVSRFVATSLRGEPLWAHEPRGAVGRWSVDGDELAFLWSPDFTSAESWLVFLDRTSGAERRRLRAPDHAKAFVRLSSGTIAITRAQSPFAVATQLVLLDAAGEQRIVATSSRIVDVASIEGGFIANIAFVASAFDASGAPQWTSHADVTVSNEMVLGVGFGGRVERLRPSDGKPMWSFTWKGVPKKPLVTVRADADAVAVVSSDLQAITLLDAATGEVRWQAKKIVSSATAPLLVPRAVIAAGIRTLGGGVPLVALDRKDGKRIGALDDIGSDIGLYALATRGHRCAYKTTAPNEVVILDASDPDAPAEEPKPTPRSARATRSTTSLPERLRARLAELGDRLEVTRFEVARPANVKSLARAEKSIGRSLPTPLRALFEACDGLELHWRLRADSSIQGRISLLPIARMFASGKKWGDDAFEGDLWQRDFEDDLGSEVLEEFKKLRPIDRYQDSKPIAWIHTANDDEPSVVVIDRWHIQPLDLDLDAYFDRLVATLGRDGWTERAIEPTQIRPGRPSR